MKKMEKVIEVLTLKQVKHEVDCPVSVIRKPDDAFKVYEYFIADEAREVPLAIYLDVKNNILAIYKVSIGDVRSAILSPRQIYQAALLNNASSVIIGHNHPGGDVAPSRQDIETTQRIYEAGMLLGIELLDHIIVSIENGEKKHLSLKEAGYIRN